MIEPSSTNWAWPSPLSAPLVTYNSVTGDLFFDFNGNAAGGSTKFAVLDPGLALAAANFVVV